MSQQQNNELSVIEQKVIDQKRTAWGNLGVVIHTTELELQAEAQQIISKLIAPTKPAELAAAEQSLKLAKKSLEALIEKRKTITGRFDSVAARLMTSEKSIDPKINEHTAAIIKVKKEAAADELKAKQKQTELAGIAEKVRIYVAAKNAEYLTAQADLLSKSYLYALEKVEPSNLDVYLQKIKARVKLEDRVMPAPAFTAVYATQEEVNAAITEHFKPLTAQEYIDGFVADLELKYFDYELAWNNKEQAIELDKQEAADNTTAIENQKQSETVAASLQSMATAGAAVSFTGTKELKQVYKLKMEETFEHANIIIQAYLANAAKCKEELRTTKWLTGFGVKQMMTALEKLKADDDKFNFTGLIWTTQDKL